LTDSFVAKADFVLARGEGEVSAWVKEASKSKIEA
jgi:hypothetical protein